MKSKYLTDENGDRFYPYTSANSVMTENGNLNTVLKSINKQPTTLEDKTTTFNEDGSITETYSDRVMTTTFNEDGSITKVCTQNNGTTITQTTIFNEDGSISEVIS